MKRFLPALALGVALLSVPMTAQEREDNKAGEKSSATEKTGAEKPGMDIWKWANFAILFGVLAFLAKKHGGPLLQARSAEIAAGLEAGEKAQAEAAARAASVEARLANLGNEVQAMRATAREEQQREAERIQRETQNELARIRRHAELEVESAGKLARLGVRREAARLALDLAEQKVRARMSPDVQAALLDGFISQVSTTGGEAAR